MPLHRYECEKCQISRSFEVDVTKKSASKYRKFCPRCKKRMDWCPPNINAAPDWGVTEFPMLKSIHSDDPRVVDKVEGRAAYREHLRLYEKKYGRELESRAL